MLQPRVARSRAVADVSLNGLAAALHSLTFCPKHSYLRPHAPLTCVRHASHAAQGRANGPKDSAGRRLGAKKTASEYVIPGNIIFKQRGTKWFPGENVGMGKDHTIYATVAGYVRYYRNPAQHPKRRYIGVALDREGPRSKLPTPANAPTPRRLGMYAVPMNETEAAATEFLESHLTTESFATVKEVPASSTVDMSVFRPGTFRESNYEIGKAAEKKGIHVRAYDRKDRWLAWRKRAKRLKMAMLAKAANKSRKTKGKKSNKGIVGRLP